MFKNNLKKSVRRFSLLSSLAALILLASCTQEKQNSLSRTVQNWVGTDGVLDVFSRGTLMYRYIGIDKLSTATSNALPEDSIRFGYGVMDLNFSYTVEKNEKKVYFELSNSGSEYVFYENPKN